MVRGLTVACVRIGLARVLASALMAVCSRGTEIAVELRSRHGKRTQPVEVESQRGVLQKLHYDLGTESLSLGFR